VQVIQIVQSRRLWIAHLSTAYGHMEVLCGEGNEPDLQSIKLIEQFFSSPKDHIAEIRRSAFRLPLLWRPIRFAINNEGRLGLQFKNRVTGKQDAFFFADEHSSFTAKQSDIKINDDDLKRLKERGDIGSA
jgi:hypothetical protein